MRYHNICVLIIFPVVLLLQSPVTCQETALTEVTWDQVKPVFQKRCFACHRGEQARGGLDLSSVGGIKAGSTSGVAVVSGKPEESMIYTLPAHLENPSMPPSRAKIAQRELDLIFGWIQGGLSERVTAATATSANSSRPMAMRPRPTVNRTKMSHADASKNSAKTTPAGTSTSLIGAEAPARIVRRQSYVVTALATSPTASLVAVSAPRQILVYQWTDQSLVSSIPFPEGDVFSLRFSRDGSILIAGGGIGADSGKVIGFDVATGERVFEIGNENDVVLAADISPDGRIVAFGGPSRMVRLFDTVTGNQLAEIKKHTDWILSVSFSNDGLLLATGDRFGSLQVWEAATGKEFCTLRGHTGAITSFAWSADSNQLMSAGQDGTVRFWDMHQRCQCHQFNFEIGGVLSLDRNADGRFVIGGRDRQFAICTSPDQCVHKVATDDEVVELAITQDGTHVIAADVIGNMKLYRMETGALAGEFALPTN